MFGAWYSSRQQRIGLTIMEFRTLEISAERPRDGIGGLHEEIEGSVDSVCGS